MVSKAKLYKQLDSLESELVRELIPHLEKAAAGENDLVFCVAEFNPFAEFKNRTDRKTEALVLLGRRILALKEKLDDPSEHCVAERICWYCREWSSQMDPRHRDARGLAQRFLEEIHAQPEQR